MRFDLTPTDFSMLQRALRECPCSSRREREEVEALRHNLLAQAGQSLRDTRPRVGTVFTPIRSSWPSGDVIREKKSNGFYDPSQKVKVNNLSEPREKLTVAIVLEGLL